MVLLIFLFGISGCASYSYLAEQKVISPVNETQVSNYLYSGIYYFLPSQNKASGSIVSLNGSPIVDDVFLSSFDIRDDTLVYTNNVDSIFIVQNGNETQIKVEGLYFITRPSLSPDLHYVVVQASLLSQLESGKGLEIFIVDLSSGTFEKISSSEFNSESPEWFSTSDTIAYTTFSPEEGLDIHLYDFNDKKESLLIDDAGWIHLAVSQDDRLILNPSSLRIYNASDGTLISDIKEKVLSALLNKGYNLDYRFPGQAGMGTFPLDASFSPDGTEIVFDGAVEKDGRYGIVLFTIDIDGNSLKEISELIEITPEFSNDNSYSQLTPLWT